MAEEYFCALVEAITLVEAAAQLLDRASQGLADANASDVGGYLTQAAANVRGFNETVRTSLEQHKARRAAALPISPLLREPVTIEYSPPRPGPPNKPRGFT